MRRAIAFVLITQALSLAGCAGYKLTPVSRSAVEAAHAHGGPEGYIVYAPQPFLLATINAPVKDDKGVTSPPTYKFEIIHLPNFDRPYRFTRHEFLAKSEVDFKLENGWMFAGAKSWSDSTAALTALAGLAETALGLSSLNAEGAPPPAAVLFRINITDTAVTLTPTTIAL